jgi:predicted O-linked N-acetylglucosamine transferase (SPINDLY family)
MDRVELRGPEATHSAHLATYSRIDIALDTFPYNGTTTTCEALSMNVPVVSLHGEHHASRVGLSLLSAVGLGHLATDDEHRFVEIALELAAKPIIAWSHVRRSPLNDPSAFARKIERLYRDAWRRWCHQ